MLCPIKVNSNTIELIMHNACCWVLVLICVKLNKYCETRKRKYCIVVRKLFWGLLTAFRIMFVHQLPSLVTKYLKGHLS